MLQTRFGNLVKRMVQSLREPKTVVIRHVLFRFSRYGVLCDSHDVTESKVVVGSTLFSSRSSKRLQRTAPTVCSTAVPIARDGDVAGPAETE